MQGGRGRDRHRGGEHGERAGLDERRAGELTAADAQRGHQGRLVTAHPGAEPAGEGEGGRGQDESDGGDGEHGGRGDPLLIVRGQQGRGQPGGDALDVYPIAERLPQPAVGAEHGLGDGVEVAAGGGGQVGEGADLQPVEGGAAAEQVGEVDDERPVRVHRLCGAAVAIGRIVAGGGEGVAVPAAARQRADDPDHPHLDPLVGIVGQLSAEADPAADGQAEVPRGALQDHGLRRHGTRPRQTSAGQLGAGRQVLHPRQVRHGRSTGAGERPHHGRPARGRRRRERSEGRGQHGAGVIGDGSRVLAAHGDGVGGDVDLVGGGAGGGGLQRLLGGTGEQEGAGAEQRGADHGDGQEGRQQGPLRTGAPGDQPQHGQLSLIKNRPDRWHVRRAAHQSACRDARRAARRTVCRDARRASRRTVCRDTRRVARR